MIGARTGQHRDVSGRGGSCFYRAIAYQMCELQGRRYNDVPEVAGLRERVRMYLFRHADAPVPADPQLKWCQLGSYTSGYAEAPVPQVTPYVLKHPVVVHLGQKLHAYGAELPGAPLHVRLRGKHYTILYPAEDTIYTDDIQ